MRANERTPLVSQLDASNGYETSSKHRDVSAEAQCGNVVIRKAEEAYDEVQWEICIV